VRKCHGWQDRTGTDERACTGARWQGLAPLSYNAGMEPNPAAETDAWLRGGGRVVAASERAARALTAAYHSARRAEGLTAWPAPDIQDWDRFVRGAWLERCADDRMVMSAAQEQWLWAEIVSRDRQHAVLLEGPRQRVAQLAMDAHRLLCLYAPQFLQARERTGWQQDAGAFSRWLAAFDDACRAQGLLSAARLPVELAEILRAEAGERPPLLLTGFDRTLPAQRALLDVCGAWREAARGKAAPEAALFEAADPTAELIACALWCRQQLTANPHARLLVITQDASGCRGEMERIFSRFLSRSLSAGANEPGNTPVFEFSLGVPLLRIAPARAAHLLLRWLDGPIEEQELDWLFSSEASVLNSAESSALTACMRGLRRRGRQRTRWRMESFLNQQPGAALPEMWVARMRSARQRLDEFMRARAAASPREATANAVAWAELARELLRIIGWPGGRTLSSAEFQVMRRWERGLDECASLGFNGRRMSWTSFLAALERTLHETLFAPESQDAPVLIAGPAESAGLTADAIWFMGATEDAWPARGTTHPLLPLDVQRDAQMPHASAQSDFDLAHTITGRFLTSAREVSFSYARQSEGVEARPSKLVVNLAGAARPLPPGLRAGESPARLTVPFDDHGAIPFSLPGVEGGSVVLTAQSQCPFKAFAVARLRAERWEPAEPALTAAQRGQLLHAVLHSVWSGPPNGIRSHQELMQIADLGAFVSEHVRSVLRDNLTAGVREQMQQRYLDLEATRLCGLVTEWLRYEQTRVPFSVTDTELETSTTIQGLALRLRLDRVDRLSNDALLVIDYKTGDVSPRSWELPRPDDVQLPLYAGFGLARESDPVGGLVFAKIRAGQHGFAGRVIDAQNALRHDLSSRSELVRKPFTVEELIDWRDYIEKMAANFVAGHVEVNPRDYPKTCERCGLETLCRIREMRGAEEDGEDGEEADDA